MIIILSVLMYAPPLLVGWGQISLAWIAVSIFAAILRSAVAVCDARELLNCRQLSMVDLIDEHSLIEHITIIQMSMATVYYVTGLALRAIL